MESFGVYIKRQRIKKGLNQTELAALVGLDSGGLSKIENGKKQLNIDKLNLLSKFLDICLDELKKEYLSDKFAKEVLKLKVSDQVFQLAEKKLAYLKSINVKQAKLEM